MIDCEITTSQFGDEVLPFTASSLDPEPHGRGIFKDLVDGAYGPIAEYVPPPEPVVLNNSVQPTVEGAQSL